MRTAAVLPVKSFDRAKQRLNEAIAGGDRRELAEAMVADVLAALAAVRQIDEVVVVTAEPRAVQAAERWPRRCPRRRRSRARSIRPDAWPG